ncbi:MAG: YitT family protein [Clostridiales bacterium]|nr:YitT family protein [Clostridiales bacterium]
MVRHIRYYMQMILGSAVYAAGFSYFLYPNVLIIGGVTGISTIINFLSGVPVGILMILINIPIFILGFRKLGLKFMLDSAASMLLISVLVDVFHLVAFPVTENPLLAALFGGLITGAGLGLTFSTGATTGGTDIIARVFRLNYQHINLGQVMLILDAVVIGAYALIFKNYDKAMYSAISIFVASWIIDEVLYGVNYGKLVYIVSREYKAIGKELAEKLERGVTMLYGEGVYTGEQKAVLLCAIKKRQIVELKKIVKTLDKEAFVIISETREVVGLGFEKIEI